MIAIIQRFYQLDARDMTWNTFKGYLGQINRVRKWEDGKNPDDVSSMTPEEYALAVASGDLVPMLQGHNVKSDLSPSQRMIEEMKIRDMLDGGKVQKELLKQVYGGNG